MGWVRHRFVSDVSLSTRSPGTHPAFCGSFLPPLARLRTDPFLQPLKRSALSARRPPFCRLRLLFPFSSPSHRSRGSLPKPAFRPFDTVAFFSSPRGPFPGLFSFPLFDCDPQGPLLSLQRAGTGQGLLFSSPSVAFHVPPPLPGSKIGNALSPLPRATDFLQVARLLRPGPVPFSSHPPPSLKK